MKKKNKDQDRKPIDPRQHNYTQTRNNIKSIKINGVELFPMVKAISSKRWNQNRRILYDDIVSSVLLALAQVVQRFDPKHNTKLSTYVYPRLFFGALDGLRRETRYILKHDILDDINLNEPDPSDLEAYVDSRILFNKVIFAIENRLDHRYAIALIRKYFEGASNDTIATELSISLESVDSLLANAIAEVRRFFPGVEL